MVRALPTLNAGRRGAADAADSRSIPRRPSVGGRVCHPVRKPCVHRPG
ncbi:hypothetical protein [Lysobacter gummosus]